MAVMKEIAYRDRVCPKHGPFYQDRNFWSEPDFDYCPKCESEAFEQECFEEATERLNSLARDAEDFIKQDATALEAPTILQALALIQVCLTWRRANERSSVERSFAERSSVAVHE